MDTIQTKITIRKYFLIIAVAIGVVAAMSQLFFDVNSEAVIEVRKEQRSARKDRDAKRVMGMDMLNDIYTMNVLPDSLNKKVAELFSEHQIAEKKSEILYSELLNLKNAQKIRNFPNYNSFADAIGNPILILITGILFILLYILRNSIDWKKISKAFIHLGLMYLFVASVYLIWAFSNSLEIHRVYYIVGLIFASIFATFGLNKLTRYLFNVDFLEKEKYKKIIRLLFRQLLFTIPKKGYVKEDKMIEFTDSNNEVINKVAKEID
ncbi:hypothetical protein [Kordia sp.]|uniref:hypothetical protein n=1 Tax=Kordia sp. TaxID=1965332 RepID=UPI003D287286